MIYIDRSSHTHARATERLNHRRLPGRIGVATW